MKRLSILLLILLLYFTYPLSSSAAPDISAQAAAVIDVKSGRILFDQNSNTKLPIASLTKIMTAIVAIEEGKLTDIVQTGPNAVGTEGSSIYLRLGEKLSLENLLYGLMLRSGNDAAMAIAEHIGGSMEGFAYLMNEKAVYLGLKNSHFMNPHGLDHPEHYSTAHDLAILTAYALQNPDFQKIVSVQKKTAPLEGYNWDRTWYNKNKMLRMYQGADGVKTGYTKIAKRCLVSSATRGGRQIAVVVLNDGNDWNDSARLLDYGFNEYQEIEIIRKGQIVQNESKDGTDKQQFIALRSLTYPLRENESKEIRSEVVSLKNRLKEKNSPTGYLNVYLKNQLIDSVPLIYSEQKTFSSTLNDEHETDSFWETWCSFWSSLF